MGINHRISTPISFRRGSCVSKALKVPSGVYWRTLTSYITAFLLHSGTLAKPTLVVSAAFFAAGWHEYIARISKGRISNCVIFLISILLNGYWSVSYTHLTLPTKRIV